MKVGKFFLKEKEFSKFRTNRCGDFLQQNCSRHKPFVCPKWHFENQYRRMNIQHEDGTFNYCAEFYCPHYNEIKGECPHGESCPFLHRNVDDSERLFHPRFYKTAICSSGVDDSGICTKNGVNCPYSHSQEELKAPVFDIREFVMDNYIDCTTNDFSPLSLDDWSKLMAEKTPYNAEYISVTYKTEACRKPARLCRQGFACPYYHNSKDRRRSPEKFKYDASACSFVKFGQEWMDPKLCKNGDLCFHCHTRTEQQFHPRVYKTSKCSDLTARRYCPRRQFCAFAHSVAEKNKHFEAIPELTISLPRKEPPNSYDESRPWWVNKVNFSPSAYSTTSVQCLNLIPQSLHCEPHKLQNDSGYSCGNPNHAIRPNSFSIQLNLNRSYSCTSVDSFSTRSLVRDPKKTGSDTPISKMTRQTDFSTKIDCLSNALEGWKKDSDVAKRRIEAAEGQIRSISQRIYASNDHELAEKYIKDSFNLDKKSVSELMCLLDGLKAQLRVYEIKVRFES